MLAIPLINTDNVSEGSYYIKIKKDKIEFVKELLKSLKVAQGSSFKISNFNISISEIINPDYDTLYLDVFVKPLESNANASWNNILDSLFKVSSIIIGTSFIESVSRKVDENFISNNFILIAVVLIVVVGFIIMMLKKKW
jgi:hypothetical protein